MNKITIGVDIDDTVCTLSREIDMAVCARYPMIQVNKNEYFLGARYSRGTTRLYSGIICKIMYNHLDWNNLKPAPGCVAAIKKLQRKGVKIVFITHRSEKYTPDVKKTTEAWLKKYFSNYDIIYAKDKIGTAEKLGCKYLIDNSHTVLLQRPTGVNLIFYTGLQPTTPYDVGLHRYRSWEEIVQKIIEK